VSQKLSQQYSRHRRVRMRMSGRPNRTLRHSADHPNSPRAPARISAFRRSSNARRTELPARSQTKWNSSWTKIRGNSARAQSNPIERSRRYAPAWTGPRRSRSPRTFRMRTGRPAIGGKRRSSARACFSWVGSSKTKSGEDCTLRVPSLVSPRGRRTFPHARFRPRSAAGRQGAPSRDPSPCPRPSPPGEGGAFQPGGHTTDRPSRGWFRG